MQTISGFFEFYSQDVIANLLNDERRAIDSINFTDLADVCSLRLTICISKAESAISLYLSNPDLDSPHIKTIVNDFTAEFVYLRKAVLPIPSALKEACEIHRVNLKALNQNKLNAVSVTQSLNTSVCDMYYDEGSIYDFD